MAKPSRRYFFKITNFTDSSMSSTPNNQPQAAEYSKQYDPFFVKRVFEDCKMTEEQTWLVLEHPEIMDVHENSVVKPTQFVQQDSVGNINIYPFTLDGSLRQKEVKRSKSKMGGWKIDTFHLTRWKDPEGKMKYHHPSGFGTMPMFTPQLLDHYRHACAINEKRTAISEKLTAEEITEEQAEQQMAALDKEFNEKAKVKTLVITEGYFKCLRAWTAGIPCVGIAGISVIHDKIYGGTTKLYPDIIKLIKACETENVIILWDADASDISLSDLATKQNLTKRPRGFLLAAEAIRTALKDCRVSVFLSTINKRIEGISEGVNTKGLDDLLNAADDKEVATQLLSFNEYGKFFNKRDITKTERLEFLFHLDSAESFYEAHAIEIGSEMFMFGSKAFIYDETEKQLKEHNIKGLPKNVDVGFYLTNGFYKLNGCYYTLLQTKYDTKVLQLSNWLLECLYLIAKPNNKALRVVKVTHTTGQHERIIELPVQALNSLVDFKNTLESKGPFNSPLLSQPTLEQLKMFWFGQERFAVAINSLGHHKKGFWAWANGIYHPDDGFIELNPYGIARVKDQDYYIRTLVEDETSDEQGDSSELFVNIPSEATFDKWAKMFVAAYTNNGKVALGFLLVCMYRDIIMPFAQQMPLLFCFGPKGSGKTEMIKSILALYGKPRQMVNLHQVTPKAMVRLVGQYRNAPVGFDEYKDGLHKDIIEGLKSMSDGVGAAKAKFSNDNQTVQSVVLSGAMLAGQHMPNEEALFSRSILLEYFVGQFGNTREAYQQLKDFEKLGLTDVIHDLYNYRKAVSDHFKQVHRTIVMELNDKLKANINIIDRQKNFVATILALVRILGEEKLLGEYGLKPLAMPYKDEDELANLLREKMAKQATLMQSANEVKDFFEKLIFLIEQERLVEDKDFKLDMSSGDLQVFIRLANAYPLYEKEVRQPARPFPKASLISYFSSEPSYVGVKQSTRFPEGGNSIAYAFNCKLLVETLGIDIAETAATVLQRKTRKAIPAMPDAPPSHAPMPEQMEIPPF